jgi:hypothetical protein
MPVIVKKRLPPLALTVVRIALRKISRDSGEADRDPKLREFSLDFSGTPAVRVRKSANERLHLS